MRTHKLFVYGTLKTYPPFLEFLERGVVRYLCKGKIKAKKIKFEYPAVVEDKKNLVSGEIFEIIEPNLVFPVLDEYEEFNPKNPVESLYVRKIKRAVLENGKLGYVFVYIFNKKNK